MTWEQVALGVVSLVAVGLGVQCWRMRKPWLRAGRELLLSVGDERTLLRERAHLAERRLEEVKHALSVLWHHVRPETKGEGAAVGTLRDVFSGLPIPGKPRLLDLDKAQVVLGAMLRRAEATKRAVAHIGRYNQAVAGTHYNTLREVMAALHLEPPEGSAPLKPEPIGLAELADTIRAGQEAFQEGLLPEPPAPVLDALEVLNAALEADPTAMRALMDYRPPCNDALARHPTIQVSSGPAPTVSALGLINGCLGLVPAGPKEGWGWVALETDRAGVPLRFVLSTVPEKKAGK